jgi:hypothetical protein
MDLLLVASMVHVKCTAKFLAADVTLASPA